RVRRHHPRRRARGADRRCRRPGPGRADARGGLNRLPPFRPSDSKDRAMSTSAQATHDTTAHDGAAGDAGTGEFLTFVLGEEEYGVDILRVQEIRSYDAVTRLPDAPDYIKGVINLRGIIVPVVDMRLSSASRRPSTTRSR